MKCSKREITLSSEVALVNYVNFSFIASLLIRRKRKKNISLIVGAFSFLRACANREKWKRTRGKNARHIRWIAASMHARIVEEILHTI